MHLIDWIESEQNANEPFGSVLQDLAMAGYPVRAAFPYLVVQETRSKARTTNEYVGVWVWAV